jgi:hypothetical protein
VGALALVLIAWAGAGCSKTDVRNETVATANGEDITVQELREFLGLRGGATAASAVPAQKKKEALDRLLAGRLLAQDARSKGLDKTDEFWGLVKQNEQVVLITALFRKEVASKLDISGDDIREETKRLRAADNTLSEEMANVQASRELTGRKMREIERNLVDASKKAFPAMINQEAIEKIGRGEKVEETHVIATVAGDNVIYGDVRKLFLSLTGGMHGGQDLSGNPVATQQVLDREVAGRALSAYARQQGIEGSEWIRTVRRELEQSILIDLLAKKELAKEGDVTDRQVQDAYAQHKEMFVRDEKTVPFSQVRDQLRESLRSEKRRKIMESYVGKLREKADIVVKEDLLGKV